MSNEILVAGMHMPDNQFTRFVLSYGFKVTHRPDSEANREVPITSGALICTSQISHPFRNKIIEAYKSKGLPWLETRSDSTSEIKEKFEESFVAPFRHKLNLFSSMEEQVTFFIMHFHPIGTKIRSSDVTDRMRKYVPTLTDAYANAVYSKLGSKDIIEKINGKDSRGMWRVAGLSENQYLHLSAKAGYTLPESWRRKDSQDVEFRQFVEVPANHKENQEDIKKEFEEFKEEVNKNLNNFTGQISTQVQTLVRAVERMSLTVNKDSKEALIQDITNHLSAMPVQEILKYKTMIDIWNRR